jgi:hypothetical protein
MKATIESLNSLHDAVAKQLSSNLDDPKVLAQAITFLKNNGIKAELMESQETQSLFDTVKALTCKPTLSTRESVDDLLEDYA